MSTGDVFSHKHTSAVNSKFSSERSHVHSSFSDPSARAWNPLTASYTLLPPNFLSEFDVTRIHPPRGTSSVITLKDKEQDEPKSVGEETANLAIKKLSKMSCDEKNLNNRHKDAKAHAKLPIFKSNTSASNQMSKMSPALSTEPIPKFSDLSGTNLNETPSGMYSGRKSKTSYLRTASRSPHAISVFPESALALSHTVQPTDNKFESPSKPSTENSSAQSISENISQFSHSHLEHEKDPNTYSSETSAADQFDVISSVDTLRDLLSTPATPSKKALALAVHKVGRAIVIESSSTQPMQSCANVSETHYRSLQTKLLYYSVLAGVESAEENKEATTGSTGRKTEEEKDENNLGNKSYKSNESHTDASSPQLSTRQRIRPSLDSPPDKPSPDTYARSVCWRMGELKMLVGSNLPLVHSEEHGTDLRLHLQNVSSSSGSEQSNKSSAVASLSQLELLELWLENVLSAVSHVALCYHNEGIVEGYQIIPTSELPNSFPSASFEPVELQQFSGRVLKWLRAHCTRKGASYLVLKDPNSGSLKLYDLCGFTKYYTAQSDEERKGEGNAKDKIPRQIMEGQQDSATLLSDRNVGKETGSAMKGTSPSELSLPMSTLYFRMAEMALAQPRKGSTEYLHARGLLEKCVALIDEKSQPVTTVQALLLLIDLYEKAIRTLEQKRRTVSAPVAVEVKLKSKPHGNKKSAGKGKGMDVATREDKIAETVPNAEAKETEDEENLRYHDLLVNHMEHALRLDAKSISRTRLWEAQYVLLHIQLEKYELFDTWQLLQNLQTGLNLKPNWLNELSPTSREERLAEILGDWHHHVATACFKKKIKIKDLQTRMKEWAASEVKNESRNVLQIMNQNECKALNSLREVSTEKERDTNSDIDTNHWGNSSQLKSDENEIVLPLVDANTLVMRNMSESVDVHFSHSLKYYLALLDEAMGGTKRAKKTNPSEMQLIPVSSLAEPPLLTEQTDITLSNPFLRRLSSASSTTKTICRKLGDLYNLRGESCFATDNFNDALKYFETARDYMLKSADDVNLSITDLNRALAYVKRAHMKTTSVFSSSENERFEEHESNNSESEDQTNLVCTKPKKTKTPLYDFLFLPWTSHPALSCSQKEDYLEALDILFRKTRPKRMIPEMQLMAKVTMRLVADQWESPKTLRDSENGRAEKGEENKRVENKKENSSFSTKSPKEDDIYDLLSKAESAYRSLHNPTGVRETQLRTLQLTFREIELNLTQTEVHPEADLILRLRELYASMKKLTSHAWEQADTLLSQTDPNSVQTIRAGLSYIGFFLLHFDLLAREWKQRDQLIQNAQEQARENQLTPPSTFLSARFTRPNEDPAVFWVQQKALQQVVKIVHWCERIDGGFGKEEEGEELTCKNVLEMLKRRFSRLCSEVLRRLVSSFECYAASGRNANFSAKKVKNVGDQFRKAYLEVLRTQEFEQLAKIVREIPHFP